MSILIVHIGLGKAGSSAIQKALESHIEPQDYGSIRAVYAVNKFGPGLFSEAFARTLFPSRRSQDFLLQREYLSNLAGSYDIVLMSGEVLTHSSSILKVRVFDELMDIFESIRVVAFVRDPSEWNAASAAQLIVDGTTVEDLTRSPYLATQGGFLSVFKEYARTDTRLKLHVSKYEQAQQNIGGIVDQFVKVVKRSTGVESFWLPAAERLNVSLSPVHYLAISRVNELHATGVIGKVDRLEFVRWIYKPTPDALNRANERFCQFTAKDNVEGAVAYDHILLKADFGLDYGFPKPMSDSNLNFLTSSYRDLCTLFSIADVEHYLAVGSL